MQGVSITCHCEPILRLAWQSQGIHLDVVYGRTIVHVQMYNEQLSPTVEKCLAGDCHVGALPLLAMTSYF